MKRKWVSKVQAYYFDREYNKGKMNVVADALSIKPVFVSMEAPKGWKEKLSLEYSRNQFACELIDGSNRDDLYKEEDGVIYYKDIIYLVRGSYLKNNILEVSHDSPLEGHLGYWKKY